MSKRSLGMLASSRAPQMKRGIAILYSGPLESSQHPTIRANPKAETAIGEIR